MTMASPQIAETAEGGRSHFDGDEHVLTVRIYYEDTDAGGVVYYANYLKYAERGRSALLRLGGWENGRLSRGEYAGQAGGVAFVMRRFEADYLRSAMLDDLLEIRTRVVSVGGATLEMAQTIRRGEDVLVEARAKLACVSAATQRPARMPEALRADMTARLVKS
ncbi:tol-pal system-associated acyl-CoA thioesterase [Oleispirillum naphthae]|uniref:tol-pal system-associated acyl-CoA thioesterase n=1 Tax=Oleispirillum naphthae TaxID=2838853 RepID=UPI0030822864